MKKKKSVFKKILIGALLVLSILIVLETMRDPDARKELSGSYYFYYGDGCAGSILTGYLENGIYPKVIDYDYNSDFIIAVQKPDYSRYKFMISSELDMDNTDVNGTPIDSHSLADSVLKHEPYYIKIFSRSLNYWIISHKDKQVYGPYSEEEYLQKRVALGVPDNLQLDVG